MYILKNSLVSIVRNKSRNILIGIIILVIASASTVTLAIRNTASKLVTNYIDSNDIIATISFDRKSISSNFKGGRDSMKDNMEAFNNIESFTIEDIKNYGDSQYLKGYYYIQSTSLDSDTLTKAEESFEIPDNTNQNSMPSIPGNEGKIGGNMQNARLLSGDFELNGYSAYEAMTDFVEGKCTIIDGEMITDFDTYQCVINSELASLNEISVGDTIELKNSNTQTTYNFIVKGIYEDNSDTSDVINMFSNSANKIITGSETISKIASEDSQLVINLTPSFILLNDEVIDAFSEEVASKGLDENYTINTNLKEIESAVSSITNVKTFATTFLIIILIIAAIVLFVINMINIRERKYEIGVFRTIGMSKTNLTLQFILELLIVTIVMLIIGTMIGAFISKPVGNMLLKNEIESSQNKQIEISTNFGRGDKMMDMNFGGVMNSIQAIDEINAVVDFVVIIQLLAIGIALTLISSIASMISIQRFSPLTILKERS